jgi:hypothetical protein
MNSEMKVVPVRNITIILVSVGALALGGFALGSLLTAEQGGGLVDAAPEVDRPTVAQPEAGVAQPVRREWLPEEIGVGPSAFAGQGPLVGAEDTGYMSLGRYYALTQPEVEAPQPVGREWLPEEIDEGLLAFAGQGPLVGAEDTGYMSLGEN